MAIYILPRVLPTFPVTRLPTCTLINILFGATADTATYIFKQQQYNSVQTFLTIVTFQKAIDNVEIFSLNNHK